MTFLTAYAICMLVFMYRYRGPDPGFFLFLACALSALFLYRRRLPARPDRHSHIAAYDRIRLLALILVIATHTISANTFNPENPDARLLPVNAAMAVWAVTIVCNPLYVMLSGCFLYAKKEKNLLSFYWDKFLRVLLPMFLYYLWYLWAHERLIGQPQAIPVSEAMRDFFSMGPSLAPHMWLIWRILFLYLTAPLMGRLLRALSYRRLTILFFICMAVSSVITYLPLAANIGIVRNEWPEWLLAAAAGWWLSRNETRRFDTALIAAGLISGILIGLYAWYHAEDPLLSLFVCNTAPLAILLAMGIGALMLHLSGKPSGSGLLALLTEYNYDMVLIHWGALYFIVRQLPAVRVVSLPLPLLTVLEIPLTLAVSLCAAFGIRRFFVYPVVMLLSRAASAIHFSEN